MWSWLLLAGVLFTMGIAVGTIIPWSIFLENRFAQVATCPVVLQTLEGGVILDGARAAGVAESFWQLSRATLERFSS